MQEIIINILNEFGYIGVFLLITIENIFPPIPSEVILTFGGFMTTYTKMNLWNVIFAATFGSILGAVILYLVGRILNVQRIEKIVDGRLGKILHLKKEDIKKAEHWFNKSGNKTVFFCRFIPIVRSLISIPAGMAKMNFGTFFALTTMGTFIWNIILIVLGRISGGAWQDIAGYFDTYSSLVLVILVLIIIILGVVFIKKRFMKYK